MSIKQITQCRLCDSKNLEEILDFGSTPPANALLHRDQLTEIEPSYPLKVVKCECGSVQLLHTVNASDLFKHYIYTSSTSASFREHFKSYAESVVRTFNVSQGALVVDIGSNDNILLKPFKELGMRVVGVEPATNIVEQVKNDGIHIVNDFFNPEVAQKIQEEFGQADIITCNNCFAHIDDLTSVVLGIKSLLSNNGVFVFENAYLLDTIKNSYFDQVYHEHIFYHSLKPLKKFFKRFDLEIFKVERNNIQGGTIRCFVKHANGQFTNWSTVEECIDSEECSGLYNTEMYKNWFLRIKENGQNLANLLKKLKQSGKKVVAYSYPAKATTLCSFYEIGYFFNFVIEDSKLKQGLWTPKFKLPIFDKSKLHEADYAVILAWNFKDTIINNNKDFKGKWIVPLPLEII